MLHTIVAAIAQLLLVLCRMITRGQVLTPTARPLGYELSVLRWSRRVESAVNALHAHHRVHVGASIQSSFTALVQAPGPTAW
jgi:hypothetical protein